MARKRTVWPESVDAQIRGMMAQGGTAESISQALTAQGVPGASRPTIGRRMQEIRGTIHAPRSPSMASADPPPDSDLDVSDVPDEIPDGTPLDRLDRWLSKVNGAIEAAEAAKNYPLLGQLIARGTALQDARRKAAPPPKVDPNANPDMLAAKERARKEFHRLVEQVTT